MGLGSMVKNLLSVQWDLFLTEGPDEVDTTSVFIGPCGLCQMMWHLVDEEIVLYLAPQ